MLLGVDPLGGGGESGDELVVTTPAPEPTPSNWESLRGVIAASRADAAQAADARPVACRVDGEPLQDVRGVLHCRFCGRTY